VVPTTDYAASAWFGPGKMGTEGILNRLGQVQRLGARLFLRAFRQVSLEVLEAEVCLESARDRLTHRTAKHAAKLLAAGRENPAREALLIRTRDAKYCYPLQHTLRVHQKRLLPEGSVPITPQPAWIWAPWEDWSHLITIKEETEAIKALNKIAASKLIITYTDASCRNGLSGIGVVLRTEPMSKVTHSMSVGRPSPCSVLTTELTAIREALQLGMSCYIYSDSTKALSAIRMGNKAASCRAILRDISLLIRQRKQDN
jgi:hypothetical protein